MHNLKLFALFCLMAYTVAALAPCSDELLKNTFVDEILLAFAEESIACKVLEEEGLPCSCNKWSHLTTGHMQGFMWPGKSTIEAYSASAPCCVIPECRARELYAFVAKLAGALSVRAPLMVYRESPEEHSFAYAWDNAGNCFVIINSGALMMSEDAWRVDIAALLYCQKFNTSKITHYTAPALFGSLVAILACCGLKKNAAAWGVGIVACVAFFLSRLYCYSKATGADHAIRDLPGIDVAKGLIDRFYAFPEHYQDSSLIGAVLRGQPRLRSRIERVTPFQ